MMEVYHMMKSHSLIGRLLLLISAKLSHEIIYQKPLCIPFSHYLIIHSSRSSCVTQPVCCTCQSHYRLHAYEGGMFLFENTGSFTFQHIPKWYSLKLTYIQTLYQQMTTFRKHAMRPDWCRNKTIKPNVSVIILKTTCWWNIQWKAC